MTRLLLERLSPPVDDATRRQFLIGGLSAAALLAACGSDVDTSVPSGSGDGGFPVTTDHKYGRTEIRAEPKRVVTVGLVEQDALLALGGHTGRHDGVVWRTRRRHPPVGTGRAWQFRPARGAERSRRCPVRADRSPAPGPDPRAVFRDHPAGLRPAGPDSTDRRATRRVYRLRRAMAAPWVSQWAAPSRPSG
ncbi:MAG: hypothetical protein ACRDSF_16390 [Pseudonocardiaceae bacterium]